jgi:hypothetical protein
MRQPSGPHGFPGTQPHVTVRVRISLPKKAALYTMKFLGFSNNALRCPHLGVRGPIRMRLMPIPADHPGGPGRRTGPVGAGGDARGRPPGRGRARHDRHPRRAGRHDGRARPALPRVHRERAAGRPGAAQLPRLPEVDLHLGQPRGLPRHPGDKRLKQGDIVNIDVTVIKDGFHGDTSRMYFVGKPLPCRRSAWCDLTFEAMWLGIRKVRPGAQLGDIGAPSSSSSRRTTSRWCANTAVTASAAAFTRIRRCCTTATAGTGLELRPA